MNVKNKVAEMLMRRLNKNGGEIEVELNHDTGYYKLKFFENSLWFRTWDEITLFLTGLEWGRMIWELGVAK